MTTPPHPPLQQATSRKRLESVRIARQNSVSVDSAICPAFSALSGNNGTHHL